MNKPIVTLKNVKTFEGHDGIGMNADIYIDGIKCLHVHDGAYGGCYDYTNYEPFSVTKQKEKELEAYIKTLPPDDAEMDYFIEAILQKQLQEKENKKIVKLYKFAFVFGIPNGTSYQQIKYKTALKDFAKDYPVQFQKKFDEIVEKYCKNGVKILNTNLEELGLIVKK